MVKNQYSEHTKSTNLALLPNFLTQTAAEVVELQEIFDLAYEQELTQAIPSMAANTGLDTLLNEALLPSRLFVGEQVLKCHLHIEKEQSFHLAFEVKTIPLSFELLMEKKYTEQQKLSIHVTQIPLVNHPFAKSSKT